MPTVIFIEHNGQRHEIEAETGESLMQIAVDNSVPGIDGDCGGACTCGTCHAYIVAVPGEALPDINAGEDMMLDGVSDRRENSRLCCQLDMREDWDGITVHLPESQF